MGVRAANWKAFHREHQAHLRARARQERRELTDHMEEHFEDVLAEVEDSTAMAGTGASGPGAGTRVGAAGTTTPEALPPELTVRSRYGRYITDARRDLGHT